MGGIARRRSATAHWAVGMTWRLSTLLTATPLPLPTPSNGPAKHLTAAQSPLPVMAPLTHKAPLGPPACPQRRARAWADGGNSTSGCARSSKGEVVNGEAIVKKAA